MVASHLLGDGASQPDPSTRFGCYGCFLPDLTGFTTFRHRGDRPPPPYRFTPGVDPGMPTIL